jgi:hypothetical protein
MRGKDPRTTRTISVRVPGAETQYWLTDQVFAEGDRLVRNGHTWVVSEILPPSHTGSYLTIVLRKPEGLPAP